MNDRREYSSPYTPFLIFALLVVAACIGAGVYYKIHPLLSYLIGANLATFFLYGYDKAIAGGTKTRVPETVLHGVAFAGGTPAALASRILFRHKTTKPAFQKAFWGVITLQILLIAAAVWIWLHPPAWLAGFLKR